MKKKALVLALAFSTGVLVSAVKVDAKLAANGTSLNGTSLNGTSLNGTSLSTAGLDFTMISHQGLGK